jgi:hypothetical protein
MHLLHLVGILFPHIIDDARSKAHQALSRVFEEAAVPNYSRNYCALCGALASELYRDTAFIPPDETNIHALIAS